MPVLGEDASEFQGFGYPRNGQHKGPLPEGDLVMFTKVADFFKGVVQEAVEVTPDFLKIPGEGL